MTVHVPSLLVDKKSSKPLSPVDIVMGTPWGEVDPGNSLRLSLLYHVFKTQHPGKSSGGRLTTRRRRSCGGPQSFVKLIRKGGTSNSKGMQGQMNYLTQKGEVGLELSDLYFGATLSQEEWGELLESWNMSGANKGDYDKTHHFVVSFPHGTEKDAAYRAGRAWASELFASGKYDDVYDYYTAFHTNKDHPHMHVVVLRRGMENGQWLSIHRDGVFNYQKFREVQVEVAADEGIYLNASSRYSRGLSDRPIPDAEYRRAEREGRKPMAPSHSPVTAMRAAASIALYAAEYSTDARLIQDRYPDLAKALREMAATLLNGRELTTDHTPKSNPSLEEAKKPSELIMSRRSEILAGIKEIDAEISTLPISKDRSLLERDASRIKAEAAQHLPDVADLIIHTRDHPDGLYKGIQATDGVDLEIKERADRTVGELAKQAGIDPDRFVSRYGRGDAASIGLADRWRQDELEDIQQNLTYQNKDTRPREEFEPLAQAAYDELHKNALQTYRQAERELEQQAARRRELLRIAKLVRDGSFLQPAEEQKFRETVRETLTPSELQELELGQSKVFKHVAKTDEEQRTLSRRYLEGEKEVADGTRSKQLDLALQKIDRDAEMIAQRAAQKQAQRGKDQGLDL